MKKNIITLIIISIASIAFAQTDEKLIGYFDYKGELCQKEQASSYRKVSKIKTGGWIVKEYYLNDNLKSEGFFENYTEMIGRKGDFIFFDINGKKKYTLNYHSDYNFKIAQVWDVNNNEVLKEGSGINILNDEEGIFYAYYKDSVEIWNKNYRQIQKDTVYIFALNGINPKPKNMSKFQEEVMKLIDFTEFKANIRQQTRIYAKFIVDESGKLKDFQFKNITNNSEIITTIKCQCDSFKKWEAGSVNGEKKQFYFAIPFSIEP